MSQIERDTATSEKSEIKRLIKMLISRYPISLLSQHRKVWKCKYLGKYQDKKLKKVE